MLLEVWPFIAKQTDFSSKNIFKFKRLATFSPTLLLVDLVSKRAGIQLIVTGKPVLLEDFLAIFIPNRATS